VTGTVEQTGGTAVKQPTLCFTCNTSRIKSMLLVDVTAEIIGTVLDSAFQEALPTFCGIKLPIHSGYCDPSTPAYTYTGTLYFVCNLEEKETLHCVPKE